MDGDVEVTVVMRFRVAPDEESLTRFLEDELGCDVSTIETEEDIEYVLDCVVIDYEEEEC